MVTAEEKRVLWQREEILSVKVVSLDTGREISGIKVLEDIKCISDNCIYFENFLCVDSLSLQYRSKRQHGHVP